MVSWLLATATWTADHQTVAVSTLASVPSEVAMVILTLHEGFLATIESPTRRLAARALVPSFLYALALRSSLLLREDCFAKMVRRKVCGGDTISPFHAGACGVGLGKNLTEDSSRSVR